MTKEEAIQRRAELNVELGELQKIALSFGFTGNRKYYARGTIPTPMWNDYKNNSKKIVAIETEMRVCRDVILQSEDATRSDWEISKQIIIETFGRQFMSNFLAELNRRKNGETSIKVSLPEKQNGTDYKRLFQDLMKKYSQIIDTFADVRTGINRYIAENEPEVNKAEYLQKVEKLNRCCPPLTTIQSWKLK